MLAIGSTFRAFKIALPLAIILGLGISLWLAKRDARTANEALGAQKLAHAVTLQSLSTVTTSLNAQTAMVREWTRVATERQNAARIALGAAVAREKRSGEAILRIEMERAQRASGPMCPTSEAVMAARDFL